MVREVQTLVSFISDNGISPKEVSRQEFSSSASKPLSGRRSRLRRVWKALVGGGGAWPIAPRIGVGESGE